MSRIYKILKNFTGETYRPKIVASFDKGYTVLTTSDDTGLMFYRYPNYYHISFSFDLDDITKIIGKRRNYELVISNDPHIEFRNGKKVDIVGLSFTDADDIVFPDVPDKGYVTDFHELKRAYKAVAFYNTRILDDCDIVVSKDYMSLRNHTSELVYKTHINLPNMSIPFVQFAHMIKSIEHALGKTPLVYMHQSTDLYVFDDDATYLAILPYHKDPASPLDLDSATYIGHVNYAPTTEPIKVLGRNNTFKFNGVDIAQSNVVFNKTIPATRLNQIAAIYGNSIEVYVYATSLILDFGPIYVIFY